MDSYETNYILTTVLYIIDAAHNKRIFSLFFDNIFLWNKNKIIATINYVTTMTVSVKTEYENLFLLSHVTIFK